MQQPEELMLSLSSSSKNWRSPNDSYSSCSSSSSSSGAETVVFRNIKTIPVPDEVAESLPPIGFPTENNEVLCPLGESKNISNMKLMDGNTSAVDVTDDCNGKLDEVSLFVVPYEQLTDSELSLNHKVDASLKETSKVKKKLHKMFDFLEKQGSIIEENKEKIRRQKLRFSTMCDNWESIFQDFSFEWAGFKNEKCINDADISLTGTLDAICCREGYIDLIDEERLSYREKAAKLNEKYFLAMSEVHRLQQELFTITQATKQLNGFDRSTLNPIPNDVMQPNASTSVMSVFDYKNLTSDYMPAKIESHYEAQLISAEKVHKSLEEQNRLLCAQMVVLQDQNKIFANRCKLLEKKCLRSEEQEAKFKDLELSFEEREKYLNAKDKGLLAKEKELERQTLLQKETAILYSRVENVKIRDMEKKIANLKRELEKSNDMVNLNRSEADDAFSTVVALSSNQATLQNKLQEANNTIERLTMELNCVKKSNLKLSEFKKTAEEIMSSLRSLEINLQQQKIITEMLVQKSKEIFKERDKYRFAESCTQ